MDFKNIHNGNYLNIYFNLPFTTEVNFLRISTFDSYNPFCYVSKGMDIKSNSKFKVETQYMVSIQSNFNETTIFPCLMNPDTIKTFDSKKFLKI